MRKVFFLTASVLLLCENVLANDVEVQFVSLSKSGSQWSASVTLKHADEGWEHYADAWRVVDADGKVLATRTLLHPHVEEQPFTRSLGGIKIPGAVKRVTIEAHDKVHGWSKSKVEVDLSQSSGKKYRIER